MSLSVWQQTLVTQQTLCDLEQLKVVFAIWMFAFSCVLSKGNIYNDLPSFDC